MKNIFKKFKVFAFLLITTTLFAYSSDLSAATCTVTENSGTGTGSLPYMAIARTDCDRIEFASNITTVTTPLTITLREDVVLDGKRNVTVTGSLGRNPIFSLTSGGSKLTGITVIHLNGTAISIPGHGVHVENCIIKDSRLGIYISGHFNLISQNSFTNNTYKAIHLDTSANGNYLLASPSALSARMIDSSHWIIFGKVPLVTKNVELYLDDNYLGVPQGKTYLAINPLVDSDRFSFTLTLGQSPYLPYTLIAMDSKQNTSEFSYVIIPANLDLDEDTILGDGDASGDARDNPCTGGTNTNCDDNCPFVQNSNQADADNDGVGDACDMIDTDGDGIYDDGDSSGSNSDNFCEDGETTNCDDNCRLDPNPNQQNSDLDTMGDVCDEDTDNDGLTDSLEVYYRSDLRNYDTDGDGWCDGDGDDPNTECVPTRLNDNCLLISNADQLDTDRDGDGDACDPDKDDDDIYDDGDGDGTEGNNPCTGGNNTDCDDNCPLTPNTDQIDEDGDAIGDVCDDEVELGVDTDNDGILDDGDLSGDPNDNPCDGQNTVDCDDNCRLVPNTDQQDHNYDGTGNACESDADGDNIPDDVDNCPLDYNPALADMDNDDVGDVCDRDIDGDGSLNNLDHCPYFFNPGDTPCADDTDGDGIEDPDDNCWQDPNRGQADLDNDGIGNVCDPDIDGDLTLNIDDNCPLVPNHNQNDDDNDGFGDECEQDVDGDLVNNIYDNCVVHFNPDQEDFDNDDRGDKCDSDIKPSESKDPDDGKDGDGDGADPSAGVDADAGDNIDVGGSGCALVTKAKGPNAGRGMLLIALSIVGLFLMRRTSFMKKILTLLIVLGLLLSINTRIHALNTQSFSPNIGPTGSFSLPGSRTLKQWHYSFGLITNYAKDPLEFHNFTTGRRSSGIVDYLATINILGEVGILDNLTLGIDVPISASRHILMNDITKKDNYFSISDVTVYGKYAILHPDKYPIGFSIRPFVTAPSGSNNNFTGDKSVDLGALLIFDKEFKGGYVGANIGYKARVKDDIVTFTGSAANLNVDDEFLYGLAGGVNILDKKLQLIAELKGSTVINKFAKQEKTSPIEMNGGFRSTLVNDQLALYVGAGAGLNNGYSAPQFRVFGGASAHFPAHNKAAPVVSAFCDSSSIILHGVNFVTASAALTSSSLHILDSNLEQMKTCPGLYFTVVGHTDSRGSDAYNQKLSERRSRSVVDYFTSKGFPRDQITSMGRGESEPIAPNDSPANMEKNRRVELRLRK